jgi:hypothetical protein
MVDQIMEVVTTTCSEQLVLAMLFRGQQSTATFLSVIPLLPEVLSVLDVDSMLKARLECPMISW